MSWKATAFFSRENNSLQHKIGEEQEIDIYFSTAPDDLPEDARLFYIFNNEPVEACGVVHISINHSNKMWAVEVIKHVEDFVERIKLRQSGLKKFFFNKKGIISQLIERLTKLSPLIPLIAILPYLIKSDVLDLKRYAINLSLALIMFFFASIIAYPIGICRGSR